MLTGPPEEARIWRLHGMSRDAWKRHSAKGSWYCEAIRREIVRRHAADARA